jgi:CubicO group peptidase (beta-lactamase class C family)
VRRFRRTFGWLGALLAPVLLLPRPASGQLQPADVTAVDSILRDALKAWQVPGAAVTIVVGDRVVYLKGHGLRRLGGPDPVTPDTLFALGSCSKPFTSLLLALLVDQGRLHWDDPVRKHLEYFHLSDPLADADVRLRDLLCHRTGVDSHDLLWYRAPWGQEEMIRKAGRLPLSRPFRTAFQYQSILFSAAGQAAARAGGASWDRLLTDRLLTPLGMTSTTVTGPAAARARDRASPHLRKADGAIVPVPWYDFPEPNPAGSVSSTARDLATFLRFQLAEGVWQGKRLVSAENLLETRSPQIVLPVRGPIREMNPYTRQMAYGMGWVMQDYRGQLLHLHGGALDGFRAQLTLLPEAHLGIAVLSNLEGTQFNMAVTSTILDHLLSFPPRDWNAHFQGLLKAARADRQAAEEQRLARRHKETHPSRELSAYVGSYEDAAYGTARVSLEGGRLSWHWSSFDCPLEHYQFDTFTARHEHLVNVHIVFTLNGDGEVDRLEALDRVFRRKAEK